MKRKLYALVSLARAFRGCPCDRSAGPGRARRIRRFGCVGSRGPLGCAACVNVYNGYTVQEFASDATTVREYVAPSGIVFGVAWDGLTYPDLTPLLGSYDGEYQEALRQEPRKPGLRRHHAVRTDRVVVEKWGNLRDLRGRAYAPALIPPGVSIDEIK